MVGGSISRTNSTHRGTIVEIKKPVFLEPATTARAGKGEGKETAIGTSECCCLCISCRRRLLLTDHGRIVRQIGVCALPFPFKSVHRRRPSVGPAPLNNHWRRRRGSPKKIERGSDEGFPPPPGKQLVSLREAKRRGRKRYETEKSPSEN